jgi:hypothetical protein
MKKYLKQKFFLLLLILLFNSVSFAVDADFEYKLKALYITRLADFIVWPENVKKGIFKICIDSTEKVAIQLKIINLDEIQGRPVEIIDIPSDSSISQCDFLYISHGKVDPALATTSVFTLSSQENFSEQGGMVEFYVDQYKVKMRGNIFAINKAGIKVSSKLLRLLTIVKPLETNND